MGHLFVEAYLYAYYKTKAFERDSYEKVLGDDGLCDMAWIEFQASKTVPKHVYNFCIDLLAGRSMPDQIKRYRERQERRATKQKTKANRKSRT